jgi:DNA modification methylase
MIADFTVEEEKTVERRKPELDGKEWLQNSISIWSDIRKSPEELNLKHPAMFPKMLASRLISCFSLTNDTVLDPFAGSGSTLLAAKEMKRKSIGIELSPDFVQLYHSRNKQLQLFNGSNLYEPIIINDDSNNLLLHIEKGSMQLTITSPPYWDILNQKRSADNKENINYSNSNEDLGNIESYQEFLSALRDVFEKVYQATAIGGFCCVNLMDIRKKDRLYLFHVDTINFMQEIGFMLDDIIIWDRRQEYNNLKPLGYPYVFRINRVHEFILIFKKNGR